MGQVRLLLHALFLLVRLCCDGLSGAELLGRVARPPPRHEEGDEQDWQEAQGGAQRNIGGETLKLGRVKLRVEDLEDGRAQVQAGVAAKVGQAHLEGEHRALDLWRAELGAEDEEGHVAESVDDGCEDGVAEEEQRPVWKPVRPEAGDKDEVDDAREREEELRRRQHRAEAPADKVRGVERGARHDGEHARDPEPAVDARLQAGVIARFRPAAHQLRRAQWVDVARSVFGRAEVRLLPVDR
mmetsp:Transcript_30786/g.98472  ORF Transcript_30786/g.98472 Transcript_30786/m.98472 type:complete len:241 (+) Transcript_30786:405-1127(+)